MPQTKERLDWAERSEGGGVEPEMFENPPDAIVELWFSAVEQLKNHAGLAQAMATQEAWLDAGLSKPVLPLFDSDEEHELKLYQKFPELTAAMDMMVQWDKESILGITGISNAEISEMSNVKLHRLAQLGVTLHLGPDDEDGRLVALDMGGYYA